MRVEPACASVVRSGRTLCHHDPRLGDRLYDEIAEVALGQPSGTIIFFPLLVVIGTP